MVHPRRMFGIAPKSPPIYDFRSDTTTKPCKDMIHAIATAAVGDDVYGEDPTVNNLEKLAAALFGKEDALFVASGVMGNQVSLASHAFLYSGKIPFQSCIVDKRSHIGSHELGGAAYISRYMVKSLKSSNGKFLTVSDISEALSIEDDLHSPITSLICLENTLDGKVHPLSEIIKIREFVDNINKQVNQKGLGFSIRMHLDGARLFNAAIKFAMDHGQTMKEALINLSDPFDSISICISKGLGAPIGSILVGSKRFIYTARRFRKLFGGGWRQAGILASPIIWALHNRILKPTESGLVCEMANDHINAKYLAEGLRTHGFQVLEPETNQVWVTKLPESLSLRFDDFVEFCMDNGVAMFNSFPMRLVCHRQTTKQGIDLLFTLFKKFVQTTSQQGL